MRTLAALLLAANVSLSGADASMTAYCRGQGRCAEANPAWAWMQDKPAWMGAAKVTADAAAATWIYKQRERHPRLVVAALAGLTASKVYIIARNARELR